MGALFNGQILLKMLIVTRCELSSYLTHNNVSVIDGDSFVNLTALHTLDMSYNELKTVPNELLTTSSSWKALDFSHNNILNVPTGIQETVVEGYMYVKWSACLVRTLKYLF